MGNKELFKETETKSILQQIIDMIGSGGWWIILVILFVIPDCTCNTSTESSDRNSKRITDLENRVRQLEERQSTGGTERRDW